MNLRRVRRVALGVGLLLGGAESWAQESPPRSAPTRPGMSPKVQSAPPAPAKKAVVTPPAPAARKQPAATRFPDPEWVNVVDAARRLGLKLTWKVRGREAVLADRDTRLEVAGDRIEIQLNGQRVFLGQALLPRGGELFVTKIDLERCLVPLVRPGLIGKAKSRPQVIVIDPGHGGPDKGMINERLNLFEKTFTLDTSQRLKKILETRGWKVVLTRTDDRQLLPGKADDLRRRAAIAEEADADVFVSVHFNAVADQVEKVRGLEVFRFTPQHQPPISRAMRRLDDAQLSPGNGNDAWNTLLAHSIQNAMLTQLKMEDRGFKHERYAVLRLVSCPAVLIEGGFMSNQAEAKLIATPAYRQRLAEAIADGLTDYRATLERLRAEGKTATR